MNNLSENLKKIRKDNNLSQEQLADKLGVSRQAISKWESNVAYPEMEKLIQICKEFDLNIDDLLNKDIREVKEEQESKLKLNKYIEEFLHFTTDIVNLFCNMNFKTKIKCIFEQIIMILILMFIFMVIGKLGSSVLYSILYSLLPHSVYYKLFNILSGIYFTFEFIVILIICGHAFKIRYLDYYRSIKRLNIDNKTTQDKVIKDENISEEKIQFKQNDDKIIIRDPKHSDYKLINGIFKLVLLFVKFFFLVASSFFCLLLIGCTFSFVISFSVVKTGIFFIGLILSILSLIVIAVIVLLLIFNFVFNRKNNKKIMIWSFITSIILFGASCGLIFIGSLKFDIVDDIDSKLLETRSFDVSMLDDLLIDIDDDITYTEKDINNVIIEYDINKKFKLKYDIYNSNGKYVLHFYSYSPNSFELIRTVLSEINNKKIININSEILNVRVYASKKNIEKLKLNKADYNKILKQEEETYNTYKDYIDELERKLEQKQDDIYKLEEKISELEDKIVNQDMLGVN